MKTPERSEEEIAKECMEAIEMECTEPLSSYQMRKIYQSVHYAIKGERQKREEMVVKRIKTIFNGYGGTLGFTESELRQALTTGYEK